MVNASDSSGAFERGRSDMSTQLAPKVTLSQEDGKELDRTLPAKGIQLKVHWQKLKEYKVDEEYRCGCCGRHNHVNEDRFACFNWPKGPPNLVSRDEEKELDRTLPAKGIQLKVHWQKRKEYKLDEEYRCDCCGRHNHVNEDRFACFNWPKGSPNLVSREEGKDLDRTLPVKRLRLNVHWEIVKKYLREYLLDQV